VVLADAEDVEADLIASSISSTSSRIRRAGSLPGPTSAKV
jgi:hypothetical protein